MKNREWTKPEGSDSPQSVPPRADFVAAINEALEQRERIGIPDADLSPLTPHGEAIAAGDGTLHGAIDYWQERALKAEADLARVTQERDALKAENAKLRAALAVVHFKQEPMQ